jgi:site-specific DNA recombinase
MPRSKSSANSGKPPVRCAIYTRKSSEEGLDQAFNSLDAQRESAEAYIKSQAAEGWMCLPQHYSDGGFTGGNMERPGLRRLLVDIDAGMIDAVVVYKVDRLSRSLADFARMMEAFESRNVSFVSVTQRFSTADSMGRLTLNMLLSFAQFEREIISERTRDKLAATRRKGKWTGGHPILGYDLDRANQRLVINVSEAKRVRQIFKLYLRHQALVPVVTRLDELNWCTKAWTTIRGKMRGGRPFDRNKLYAMLHNVAYIGRVRHKENTYPGEHDAIVDNAIFERVQEALARHNGSTNGAAARPPTTSLLKGLLRCAPCDCSMGRTYSTGRSGAVRYEYYACSNAQKRGWKNCPSKSVPASTIERFVVEQVRIRAKECGARRSFEMEWEGRDIAARADLLKEFVRCVRYDGASARLQIEFLPQQEKN